MSTTWLPSLRSLSTFIAFLAATCLIGGCTQHEVVKANPDPVAKPTQAIDEQQLLNVAIVVFDSDPPDPKKSSAQQGDATEVRRAEARYMATVLRSTLADTGYWGLVRVVPAGNQAMDVTVHGQIVQSNGERLHLKIEAHDATGRTWLDESYTHVASKYAYEGPGA